ncbi:MAG: hypothetical protein OEW44_03600 [Gemmatimonadota bacterium]|jgi:hypothetical protein|nr:hypothetical protein [Gemmatimonadota bacterium]
MVPASWLLRLRLAAGAPPLGGLCQAGFVPGLLGRIVVEIWLSTPVLTTAGLDLFRVEPRRFTAILHWRAGPRARESLVRAFEEEALEGARAAGLAWPGPLWHPVWRWQRIEPVRELAAVRGQLRAGHAPAPRAGVRRSG